MMDEQILHVRDFATREGQREQVRVAIAAVLERDASLAARRDFGPLVDCLADAACNAAGLPALPMFLSDASPANALPKTEG
jgi:hypothetical protein